MKGAGIPSFNDLNSYAVNRGGEYEGVRQTLYDFQTYDAAGQTNLTFFQVPVGQNGKTLADTNMETAGTLPAPKHFLVQSIELYFFPAGDNVTVNNFADTDAVVSNNSNDVQAVGEGGSLDFFIGSKSYLQEAPLMRFPPKCRMENDFSSTLQMKQATAADLVAQTLMDYAAFSGRPYFIDPWILLTPTQNFNVKLTWPSAVPISGDGRIGVVLDGVLYRLSQ